MKKNKKANVEKVLLSAFTGLESAHAFSAFEPSIFTIQSLTVPQGQQDMIRKGYIPSVLFAVMLGGTVSALTKSKLPIVASVLTSGFMIGVYEFALRTAPVTIAKTANATDAQPTTQKPVPVSQNPFGPKYTLSG